MPLRLKCGRCLILVIYPALFHCYSLCQIPGSIHIEPPAECHIVSQKLKWYGHDYVSKILTRMRDIEDMPCHFNNLSITLSCKNDDNTISRLYLLYIYQTLFI